MRVSLALLALVAASCAHPQAPAPPAAPLSPAKQRQISPEYISNAVMAVLQKSRESVEKLELHEKRERQLGDELKKMLEAVDKRQRATDHKAKEVMSVVTRLETNIRNVEAIITQRDERDKVHQQKTQDLLESIHESMKQCTRNEVEGGKPSDVQRSMQTMEVGLNARVDNVAAALERLEALVLSSNDVNPGGADTEGLRQATARLATTESKVRQSVAETERVLSQYEVRLAEMTKAPISNTITVSELHDWHPIFLGALESHQKILQDLKHMSEVTMNDVKELPRRSELNHLTNTTHDLLQEFKYQLQSSADKGVARLEERLSEAQAALGRGQEEAMKGVSDTSAMTESLYADVTKSYEQLLKEVQGLSKVEQVMIQTADNVMDTKRRIEYGVHQILLEVGDLIKLQGKDLNETVNRRFDAISESIIENQTGALTNLSKKIETEISQVWRQIGIMYQQLTASAAVLDHLQNQTDIYVNGSLRTMDSMTGKVGLITGRMAEVDDNLNYLLGRLSLVTQEFNDIKSGLATALDNIRSSFLTVHKQILDVGPGPNPIPSNEVIPSASEEDIAPPLGLHVAAQ